MIPASGSPSRDRPLPMLQSPTGRDRDMPQAIEPGFMVFLADGHDSAGAVREVTDAQHVVINVENGGDFSVSAEAVRDVHDDKVILDYARLPPQMQEALCHLHDAEFAEYRAADPEQGTPAEE